MERNCRLIRVSVDGGGGGGVVVIFWLLLLSFGCTVCVCVLVCLFFYQQQTNLVFVGVLRLFCLPVLLCAHGCVCICVFVFKSLSVVCSVCISKPLIFFRLFMSSWVVWVYALIGIQRFYYMMHAAFLSFSLSLSLFPYSLSLCVCAFLFLALYAGSVHLLSLSPSTASFNFNLISFFPPNVVLL